MSNRNGYNLIPKFTTAQLQRLWKKISIKSNDECWLWQGAKNTDGYGHIGIKGKFYDAHRIIASLYYKFSKYLQIRHLCNNSSCCNPNHLKPGTAIEDAEDKRIAGTINSGERNGQAKLTTVDIQNILFLAQFCNQYEIAKLYNISQGHVSDILNGKKRHDRIK